MCCGVLPAPYHLAFLVAFLLRTGPHTLGLADIRLAWRRRHLVPKMIGRFDGGTAAPPPTSVIKVPGSGIVFRLFCPSSLMRI